MSDIKALLVGRNIDVADGVYLERLDMPVGVVEEWLRARLARFAVSSANPASTFVERVGSFESLIRQKSDDDLRAALFEKARAMQVTGFQGEGLEAAFAVVREASRRCLGKRHHDVQILAGQSLLQGRIAEMATGEGKTLAGTLAICVAAAAGACVHVVTVNDYLAERDAEHNMPLFEFFGLTVGVVKQDMPVPERQKQYAKHIAYVSNKELTFDYLKDVISWGGALSVHMKLRKLAGGKSRSGTLLRGLHVAIVDEADSVLIDEARTPLIISETLPDDLSEEIYQQALEIAGQLREDVDYRRGKDKDIWLTDAGTSCLSALIEGYDGVWRSRLWRQELTQKALSALHMFKRDQHYIIADNKVQIVDEFTGRVMPDRTWERGLHQMIEAKEQCDISGQRRTLSQITYQRFFGRYLLLAGMTGTAREVAPELKRVYDLPSTRIPTHKPSRRFRLADRLFRTPEEKWQEVARRAVEIAGQGRSVLVGTRSVEASELLGELLVAQGVDHVLLNARQDQVEADAVASAGEAGRITVATNMAGRGTDIKLSPEVAGNGGLHVILTEFHESARVDRQLFGRAARQGDPGTVEAIVSLQDDLFIGYAKHVSRLLQTLLLSKCWYSSHLLKMLVWYAQGKSERHNRNIRLDTIKRDREWLRALGFVGAEKK